MDRAHRMNIRAAAVAITLFASTYAQTVNPPGQPSTSNAPLGQFKIVGNSVASAQQLFLGTLDKVYIVDKVENNPTKINGHPAWAAEYSISKNNGRAMDVATNTFCAGGSALGNGTWLNVGGNQGVTTGGAAAASQTGGGLYDDADGRQSVRLLNPCDDSSCEWTLTTDMSTRRWYPTLETLDDGSVIIMGGCQWGGYVNDAGQDNPTWEIFPPTGKQPIQSNILATSLPANLYPLIWMLPSGKLLIQSNWKTALLDYRTQKETPLDDMLDAVRVYPASGGTAMLPLTPDNNYTATILFCGGSNLQPDQWTPDTWNIAEFNASTSCVRLTPDQSPSYVEDDALPEGRSMGNMILLPTGKILLLNGAQTGTAGYGTQQWTINDSYADNPILMPIVYDPSAPQGKRWSRDGLSPSTIPRMYHSSATLLPDGSVFVAGSNPHPDYIVANVKYPTEYRVEYFYPSYYNQRRPEPKGILSSLSYGGSYFNVTLTKDDLFGDVNNIKNTQVVVLRTGFSTHAMNMGQRMLQLGSSYTGNSDGSATLHVNQLPPNPATFPPGPALAFVVVNGVPSVGVQVMIGNGQIGRQPTGAVATLPTAAIASTSTGGSNSSSSQGSGDNVAQGHHKSDALRGSISSIVAVVVTGLVTLTMLASFL